MHPHMLRHTFVTTMLDAGVSLRNVQIAARHADPRTTMRYDRARAIPGATQDLSAARVHDIIDALSADVMTDQDSRRLPESFVLT